MNEMPDLKTTDREYEETPKQEMLPDDVVNDFVEGDSILVEAETKDGEDVKEVFYNLEDAKKFFSNDTVCKPETFKIELIKKIED